VVVELPGGGKPAVAHLPPDVLDKLYPHDFPPNWAEKWTGVGTVGLVVGAILAAIITYLTLRQGRKSRHAETFRDIVETWGNGEFRAVRARIWRVYEDKTAEGPEALENKTAQGLEALGNKAAATSERLRDKAAATSESLPDKAAGDPDRVLQHMRELRVALEDDYWELLIPLEFFENAGMLVKYRVISIQMVDNSLGLLVCEYWKMLRPFIYARRRGIPDWPDERDPGYYEEFERLAKRISDRHNDQPPFDFKPRRPRMWFESFAGGYRAGSVSGFQRYFLAGSKQRLKRSQRGCRTSYGTSSTPTPTNSRTNPRPPAPVRMRRLTGEADPAVRSMARSPNGTACR
jgi:hypothetical protein